LVVDNQYQIEDIKLEMKVMMEKVDKLSIAQPVTQMIAVQDER
jgi:hypothetical protein